MNFMSRTETPESILATNEVGTSELTASEEQSNTEPLRPEDVSDHHTSPTEEMGIFPTETEIYILPDGRVIFAYLPAERADLAAQLGSIEPSAVELDDSSVPINTSISTDTLNPEFSQPTEES